MGFPCAHNDGHHIGHHRQTSLLHFCVTTSMQIYDLSVLWVYFSAHIYRFKVCECLQACGWSQCCPHNAHNEVDPTRGVY